MKRVALLVLALLMLLTSIPMSGVLAAETAKEETKELPSSFTLVGTKHLPPISNQGSIGTCASSAITYMQFTNAVSRYLHSINPDIEWDPSSGDHKYIFAPKFTYNFAGSGTEWVYRILMENGALTLEDSHFLTDASGAYLEKGPKEEQVSKQTASWDVGEGMMEKALNYRFTGFDQVWIKRDADSFGVDGKVQITTTEKGKELINRIKASLVDGNVVVTGGLSGCWPGGYANNTIVSATALAKKTDAVMYCGRGDWSGGHQVCIVGYDDDIVAQVPNKNGGKTTLKGAFLMANSWGTGYQNDGYVWIMYDALNEVSEFPELNFDDRKYPMDQFCFTDWRNDIAVDKPDLYLEVGVVAGDRSKLNIELVSRRLDANRNFRTYTPYIFQYTGHQGDFADAKNYNFEGERFVGSTAKNAIGYFTFPITHDLTLGKYADLQYGVSVKSGDANSVTVLSLKLKNAKGDVLSSVSVKDGVVQGNSQGEFFAEAVQLIDTTMLPSVEGAVVTPLTDAKFLRDGSSVAFKVEPEDVTKVAKVTLDGTEVTPDADGVFTIKMRAESEIAIELVDAPKSAKKDGGSMTIVVIVIVAVAAVIVVGGSLVLVGKKKKK